MWTGFGLNFGLLSNKTGHKSVKDEVICAKAGLWTWIMLVDHVNEAWEVSHVVPIHFRNLLK